MIHSGRTGTSFDHSKAENSKALCHHVSGHRVDKQHAPSVKEFKAGHSVGTAIGALLLVAIVMVPAFIFPQYTQPKVTGNYGVATVNYTYTDTSRIETFTNTGENLKVNVEFWYPKDAKGTYPLVVFDHSILGMKISNTSTFMELANNGYVVCSIDHPYLSLFTVDTSGHRTIIDQGYVQE